VRLRFLGTGASGGTPGSGRSARRESSALVGAEVRVLLDVPRHTVQDGGAGELDAVLLTHAHRDAAGGLARLAAARRASDAGPLRVLVGPGTAVILRRRVRRLEPLQLTEVRPGTGASVGPLAVAALGVPHARDVPTVAWRLSAGGRTLVYASDVAELTAELERFCRGASLLVIDGAMWRRRLYTHLTIDRELPRLCGWSAERIVLTQIGRTAPPHERLARAVAELCPRAGAAYDGLELEV
jgi:ribonuclease BN (tRNA processing enzyme)